MNDYVNFLLKPFTLIYRSMVHYFLLLIAFYYDTEYKNNKLLMEEKNKYQIILYCDKEDNKIKFKINEMTVETNLKKSYPDSGIHIEGIAYSSNPDDQLGEINYEDE